MSRLDETELRRRTMVMRAWVQRRRETHKQWNADDLWNRIKYNWPTMSDDDKEYVYQNAW